MTQAAGEWLQLSLQITAEQLESAEALLSEHGAVAITLLDAEDHPVHEPAPGEMPLWPALIVRGLFASDQEPAPILDAIMANGLLQRPEHATWNRLADRDWARAWMDRYQPLRFGRSLWICPSHIEPDPDWPVVIRLDPGLAFGSGTHPTTALCLEWIDGLELQGRTIVDYGCGSGILAIACALKGAASIVAVDHDPQALEATADNARRNRLPEPIKGCLPEDFEPAEADYVLANILAGQLIELAPVLAGSLRSGGELVLSGILAEQADDVIKAYINEELTLIDRTIREDWVRLVMSRPNR